MVQPPFNPYLFVKNTGHDIHLIGKQALPTSINPGDPFRDSQGFPWALMVPTLETIDDGKWKHPNECQRIEIPYPRFTLWRESLGDEHVDWYLHYYNPYIPPTQPTVKRIADIIPGLGGSLPANLTVYNGALYFSATDVPTGTELWRFNGSSASRVADINPSGDSSPAYLSVYNSKLYFRATPAATQLLYSYDGSSAGPIAGVELVSHLAVFGTRLFFAGRDTDLTTGLELCSWDDAQANEAADIYSGVGNSSFPAYLSVYGGLLYFAANDGSASGRELWSYDGSTAARQTDINTTPPGNSNPSYLTVYDTKLYFRATPDGTNYELYSFDGSTLTPITNLIASGGGVAASPMVVYGNALYFVASDGTHGDELWRYDGASAAQVADIHPSGAGLAAPTYFAVFDGKLFFAADDGSSGSELYRYDGSVVSLAADINPGAVGSFPAHLAVYNSRLYFQANDGSSGAELWVYY